MDHIQIVKIYDVEDGDIYTAKIQKNGKRWIGWIQVNIFRQQPFP